MLSTDGESESLCAFASREHLMPEGSWKASEVLDSGLVDCFCCFHRFKSKLNNVCLCWDTECVLKGSQGRMGSGCGDAFFWFYLSLGN